MVREDTFEIINSHPLIVKTINWLREDLPKDLYYHSVDHTIDVLDEALYFARSDQLAPRSIELLALSAVFHDTGFISSYKNNEEIGANFAKEALTAYGGYSKEEISLITKMIMDTQVKLNGDKLQQIPSTSLSGYLLDADLSNLGRNDFLIKSTLIKKELDAHGLTPSRETVINILCNKIWHTPAAQKFRTTQHQENITAFLECIKEVEKINIVCP